MKKFLGLLLSCALSVTVSAQLDLNALKRESDARAKERKQESGSFLKERDAKWDEFMDSRAEEWAKTIANRDLEWTDFLSDSEWTLFDGFLTNKRPTVPKPDMVPEIETEPVAEPVPEPIVLPKELIAMPEPEPDIEPDSVPLPCKPIEPETAPFRFNYQFVFYGRQVTIPYDQNIKSFNRSKYSQREISDFWKSISETNYTPTVNALLQEKDKIGLNDWGYYLLVKKFAQGMYQDKNATALLTWFLLIRSGLDARVGLADNGVVLMLPTSTTLYDLNYVIAEGRKYYMVDNNSEARVRSYKGKYADGRQFEFAQRKPLQLGGNNAVRELAFKFKGREYRMKFNYDSNLADYYKALPQAQFEVFFEASPSQQLIQSVQTNLKPIIAEMDKSTALYFLLQFVQFSFQYKTDPQQFGYEKYFYADELFYYPYCDCEDRSVLFSYLAHELMGYDVVGTEFPGHMATAVAVDFDVKGVKYTSSGRTYTIADPTFMGASVGQCMSKFENTLPKIHFIDYTE